MKILDADVRRVIYASSSSVCGMGAAYSLLELLDILGEIIGIEPRPTFSDPRPGDVRHTRAEITAARRDLGHTPRTALPDGLRRTLEWFATETTRSAV
jgi:nucleoside-diphosphate-sugar epimerase